MECKRCKSTMWKAKVSISHGDSMHRNRCDPIGIGEGWSCWCCGNWIEIFPEKKSIPVNMKKQVIEPIGYKEIVREHWRGINLLVITKLPWYKIAERVGQVVGKKLDGFYLKKEYDKIRVIEKKNKKAKGN